MRYREHRKGSCEMNIDGFEIERKYLISMPDPAFLRENAESSHIEQTYLLHEDPLVPHGCANGAARAIGTIPTRKSCA